VPLRACGFESHRGHVKRRNGRGYSANPIPEGYRKPPPPPEDRARRTAPGATITVYGNDMGTMIRAAMREAAYVTGDGYYFQQVEPFVATPFGWAERDGVRVTSEYQGIMHIRLCMPDDEGACPGTERKAR
jgi:hypothetical protein